MKHILFFIVLLLSNFVAKAQFTVETHAGVPIVDGDVITFGEYAVGQGHEGELKFYVYNNSSAPINMRIEFVSATNADGSSMQLCFGLCYTGITIGNSYPPNGGAVTIQPGKHQDSDGDHFINYDAGNGSDVLKYIFRFYQVDDQGSEIGTDLTMTYQYDPLLGMEDMEKMDVSVYPTLVTDQLNVETDEKLEAAIYNLQGKLIRTASLSVGENQIPMNNLAAQIYLIRFENKKGAVQTTEVIVK